MRPRKLFYTIIFVLFCLIDQRTKTGSGFDGAIETFRNLLGVGMAGIILVQCKWDEVKKNKIPYIVWSVLGIAGGILAFLWGQDNWPFMNEWLVNIINVILWGYVLIYTFVNVIIQKKYPSINKKFAIIWLFMMLWMIFSRSNYIWPLYYLIMFACYYLTDFTREEADNLLQGALNGIIISFFLFQGFCCVFRPFDLERYTGVYNNPNLNSLFYLEVLVAVFVKLLHAVKREDKKWIRVYYWLGIGVVLSFVFMTIGRTAWMVALIMSALFLVLWNCIKEQKKFIVNGMIMVLCASMMFPVCFAMVRYIPPQFHHPVWFWGEWSEDRVHSWDPWDSEKYVDMDEFLEAALGRVTTVLDSALEKSPFAIKAEAAEVTEEVVEDPRIAAAILTDEERTDPILVRTTIYKHFSKNLNLTGHPVEEQGLQLTRYQWIGHAHNIYLQYGSDFGIPVMLMFATLVLYSCMVCWKRIKQKKQIRDIAALFFILVPCLFGMLEYSWGVSSLSITMLFLAWRSMIVKEEDE